MGYGAVELKDESGGGGIGVIYHPAQLMNDSITSAGVVPNSKVSV